MDLTVATGTNLTETVQRATVERQQREAAGLFQVQLDDVARTGGFQGEFEETEEEGAAVIEEFYSDEREAEDLDAIDADAERTGLAQKLQRKVNRAGTLPNPTSSMPQGDKKFWAEHT